MVTNQIYAIKICFAKLYGGYAQVGYYNLLHTGIKAGI